MHSCVTRSTVEQYKHHHVLNDILSACATYSNSKTHQNFTPVPPSWPLGPGYCLLTFLGPQSRFGDKLLIIRLVYPHIWECGSKRVKETRFHVQNVAVSRRLTSSATGVWLWESGWQPYCRALVCKLGSRVSLCACCWCVAVAVFSKNLSVIPPQKNGSFFFVA